MIPFMTGKQFRVLREILDHGNERVSVADTAKRANASKATVSLIAGRLKRSGILKKNLELNLSKFTTRALKIVINAYRLSPLIPLIKSSLKDARGIGVYGSWADGTNTRKSDLDLWARCKLAPSLKEVAALERVIRKRYGIDVQILALDDARFKALKESDSNFYHAIANSKVVWGTLYD
ncbi:hypothetical protein HYS54_01035 [Candidatus Micrarchaeota archaeon]|nr:hypothetical protein [Candidatus Micrarchaeota archaeon]